MRNMCVVLLSFILANLVVTFPTEDKVCRQVVPCKEFNGTFAFMFDIERSAEVFNS